MSIITKKCTPAVEVEEEEGEVEDGDIEVTDLVLDEGGIGDPDGGQDMAQGGEGALSTGVPTPMSIPTTDPIGPLGLMPTRELL